MMNGNSYSFLDDSAKTIAFLRKQKSGLIIGEYRNILYRIYNTIKQYSNNSYKSKLSEIKKHDVVLETYPIGFLLLYCRDLEKLGYITMNKRNDDYELYISKEIDF